jgi:hypothetical protein
MPATFLSQSPAGQAIRQSSFPSLRKLHVEETDLHLELTGAVSSYYLKQLAQETVMPFLGARELRNRIVVSEP